MLFDGCANLVMDSGNLLPLLKAKCAQNQKREIPWMQGSKIEARVSQ